MNAAGLGDQFDSAMQRSSELYDLIAEDHPNEAQYAVSLAYRVRYSMQLNAREAMHMLELRTSPQGHPAYRRVCQRMHRLIAEKAGHTALAAAMEFVDHEEEPTLGRLDAELKAAAKRDQRGN